jgi:hypothetical protein
MGEVVVVRAPVATSCCQVHWVHSCRCRMAIYSRLKLMASVRSESLCPDLVAKDLVWH